MTSEELTELVADYELGPWGEERADARNGMLCSLVANIMRGKDDPRATPGDFMPDYTGARKDGGRELTAEESREALKSLAGGPGESKGTLV